MNAKLLRDRLLASTIMAGLTLAGTAHAQGAPVTTAAAEAVTPAEETIIVTGSRIARPNLEGSSPVTVLTQQEAKFQGTTRVEDLINNLPQAFAGQGGNISNGSTGTATVDLRNLGPERTLVLVNGRRLVPGDPRNPVADLNTIPASLIKRVDVLTGGASSVYGADAVAGVVNFVLDNKFEGVQLDTQYSLYQHNNKANDLLRNALAGRGITPPDGNTVGGAAFTANITIGAGTDDGRGHVTAYAGYRRIDPVLQWSRVYSSCSLAEAGDGDIFSCSGSGTTAPARFNGNGGSAQIYRAGALTGNTLPGITNPFTVTATNPTGRFYQFGDVIPRFNTDGSLFLDPKTGKPVSAVPARLQIVTPTGGVRPYVGAQDAFNFAPYNYYQRPDERFTAGAFAEYEVDSHFKPYLEFMFMDDRTTAQIAPSGVFQQKFNIPCSNPLLSASQVAELCTRYGYAANESVPTIVGRRNIEGGGRQDDLRHTTYRFVVGTKGEIKGDWNYDIYGQFGRSIFSQVYKNDFSITRIGRSLNVVKGVNGAPVCASVLDGTDPNCVPYDIFSPAGVSAAALNYLQTPGFANGATTEQIVSGSVSGTLGSFQSPFTDQKIGVAVGAEYRRESLDFRTDLAFSTGDLAGQGGPTIGTNGNYDVREVFGELNIPLVSDKPFFDKLSIEAAYRYSDYKVSSGQKFSTNTYKLGAEWAPFSALRFRGGYNRAVRAPNIVEYFSAQSQGLFAGNDPCANQPGKAPSFSLAQCSRQGAGGALYGNILSNTANQYTQLTGGNPNLTPEKADTYTAGVVLAPRGMFSGLTVTVDYFNIKVKNTISTVGSANILNGCGVTGDPLLCGLIQRDPINGSLFLGSTGQVVNTNVNIGSKSTSGIDVTVDYHVDAGRFGGFDANVVGTWTEKFVTEPGINLDGVTKYDCKGYFGVTCGTPQPAWRHKARLTYNAPSVFSVSAAWRYTGPVRAETTSSNAFISDPDNVYAVDRRIKGQSYFDLALVAEITKGSTFTIGVNNIADRSPPLVGSNVLSGTTGNGNTYPQVYDALGRYIFAGAKFNF